MVVISLYYQHGISLAQVQVAEVGDGGPGDGVNLHQQPRALDPGVRVHGEKAGSLAISFSTKPTDQMDA